MMVSRRWILEAVTRSDDTVLRPIFLVGVMAVLFFVAVTVGADGGGAARYVDNGNGTVTDTKTALVWQQVDDGVGRTWEDAKTYCRELSFAGHDDWRLPSHYQLKQLLDESQGQPAIDQTFFPKTKQMYWTETEMPLYSEEAFYVNFGGGVPNAARSNKYHARCFRLSDSEKSAK